ncbi:hypothetical protein LTR10_003875 [Elasticomyces elasticus]|nr:hypothetical protein LTR10_003875 [Elasticomyces elasticus]
MAGQIPKNSVWSAMAYKNPSEDAVLKKWALQEADDKESTTTTKKRKLITQGAAPADDDYIEELVFGTASSTKAKQVRKKKDST